MDVLAEQVAKIHNGGVSLPDIKVEAVELTPDEITKEIKKKHDKLESLFERYEHSQTLVSNFEAESIDKLRDFIDYADPIWLSTLTGWTEEEYNKLWTEHDKNIKEGDSKVIEEKEADIAKVEKEEDIRSITMTLIKTNCHIKKLDSLQCMMKLALKLHQNERTDAENVLDSPNKENQPNPNKYIEYLSKVIESINRDIHLINLEIESGVYLRKATQYLMKLTKASYKDCFKFGVKEQPKEEQPKEEPTETA